MNNKRRYVTRFLFALLVIQPVLGMLVYSDKSMAAVVSRPTDR